MPKYGHNWSELLHFRKRLVNGRSKFILSLSNFIERGHLLYPSWEEVIEHLFFENCWAIFPILRVTFDKRPTVHITHIAFAIATKQVETTNILLELLYYSIANIFFLRRQYDRKALLFAFFVSHNNSIKRGSLSCFCIHIVRPDCVNFDVESICWQIFFVYIVSIMTNTIFLTFILTRSIFNFSE